MFSDCTSPGSNKQAKLENNPESFLISLPHHIVLENIFLIFSITISFNKTEQNYCSFDLLQKYERIWSMCHFHLCQIKYHLNLLWLKSNFR